MILVLACAMALAGAAVGGALVAGSRWFTQPTNDLKKAQKENRDLRRALTKVASNTAGNPTLEAQLSLEEIDNKNY